MDALRLLIVAGSLSYVGGQTSTCVDFYSKVDEADVKIKRFDLSCKQTGAVITSVIVTAGNKSCERKNGCCQGLTPELLVDSHNCYWQHNCSIYQPQDFIVTTENMVSCPGCIGSPPRYLQLKEYTCFLNHSTEQRIILDMCSETKMSRNVAITGSLLRSHPEYPWNYDSNQLMNRTQRSRTCYKTLWLTGGKKALVTVRDLDLGEEDRLKVESSTNTKQLHSSDTGITTVYHDTDDFVNFTFDVSQGSNGGKGFVVCFIQIEEHLPGDNACDMLLAHHTDVRVTDTERKCHPFCLVQSILHKEETATHTPRKPVSTTTITSPRQSSVAAETTPSTVISTRVLPTVTPIAVTTAASANGPPCCCKKNEVGCTCTTKRRCKTRKNGKRKCKTIVLKNGTKKCRTKKKNGSKTNTGSKRKNGKKGKKGTKKKNNKNNGN